jgi:hypothetical protein
MLFHFRRNADCWSCLHAHANARLCAPCLRQHVHSRRSLHHPPTPEAFARARVCERVRVRTLRNVGIDCVTSTATTVSLHWTGGSAIIPRRASCTKIDRAVNALPFPSECRLLVVLAREPARACLAPHPPLPGPRPAPPARPRAVRTVAILYTYRQEVGKHVVCRKAAGKASVGNNQRDVDRQTATSSQHVRRASPPSSPFRRAF